MITGLHGMFYTPCADELRAFFRDKLAMPHIDAGDGWLIFRPLDGELGFHPGAETKADVSLCCDDVYATVVELQGRGVEFVGEIEDHGYGLVTFIKAPGDLLIQLFQPTYPLIQ